MTRAEVLSSFMIERAKEEERVMKAIQQNSYPIHFIRRHSIRRPVDEERGGEVSDKYHHPIHQWIIGVCAAILTPLGVGVQFRPHSTLRHMLVHPRTLFLKRNIYIYI